MNTMYVPNICHMVSVYSTYAVPVGSEMCQLEDVDVVPMDTAEHVFISTALTNKFVTEFVS